MSAFRYRHEIEVRFSDLDPMGHAHHTLPLVFFEEARARYWRDVAGRAEVADIDYIMKDVQVTYHARIQFPGRVRVAVGMVELGRTSFTLGYEVRDADSDELLATGRTVQVMYDYEAGAPLAIDRDTRARIEAFEGTDPAETGP